jgi:glucosamine--fructose-6-phosphate aminotransferase (isomerizing)
MEKEIGYQIDYLHKLDLPAQVDMNDCLFIGAGDSYAAALVAHYASNYKAVCSDPVEIAYNHEIISKNRLRRVYIISVSGNTQSNILAAKVLRKNDVPTTAITAKSDSELARNCDVVIPLNYESTGISTSGTISFMCSMLCCLSLARKIEAINQMARIYRQSSKEVRNLIHKYQRKVSSYIFLADGILFPIALYGTLKVNEVFGLRSFAYTTEQFYHSPLFSLKESDMIMILANKKYNLRRSEELNIRLTKLGLPSACIIYFDGVSITELLLKSMLLTQLFIVKKAQEKGMVDCFFLRDRGLLKLSSDFIYHR